MVAFAQVRDADPALSSTACEDLLATAKHAICSQHAPRADSHSVRGRVPETDRAEDYRNVLVRSRKTR